MNEAHLKWWQVRWSRIGIFLAILFGVPLVLSAFAGFYVGVFKQQFGPWIAAREMKESDPRMSLVPAPLPDKGVAELTGLRVEQFGFSLQTPWTDFVAVNSRLKRPSGFYSLKGGGGLIIKNPDDPLDESRTEKAIVDGTWGIPADLSNYELMARALKTKTEEVKWWKFPPANAGRYRLLIVKSLILLLTPGSEKGGNLYRFEFGGIRGFQMGDPGIAPYVVQLHFFDAEDRHYSVLISPSGVGPVITQVQINGLIASLQRSDSVEGPAVH